jgi:hypothetical protein
MRGWTRPRTLARGLYLGITAGHLHDVEHSKRTVSPMRAARWARSLGDSEEQFVLLALQATADAAGLVFEVAFAAKPKKRRARKAA